MSELKRYLPPKNLKFHAFKNDEGRDVRYVSAPGSEPKTGTIIFTPGFADFIETYYETIHDFQDRGFDVHVMDWPAHGALNNKTPKLFEKQTRTPDGLDGFMRTLHQFRTEIIKPLEDKPVILAAHSMGGHIALHHLKKHPGFFDAALIVAPLIDFETQGTPRKAIELFFKGMVELGLGDMYLSGDKKKMVREIADIRHATRDDDPSQMSIRRLFNLLNRQARAEDPTYDLMLRMMESIREMKQDGFLEEITTPVLLARAGKDDMVSGSQIEMAAKRITGAIFQDIDDAYHSIWTDKKPVRDSWLETVDGFLDKTLAGHDSTKRRELVAPHKKEHRSDKNILRPPAP